MSNIQSFLNIGLDDIDTPGGGCTTHLGALLATYLMKNKKCMLIDYPNLVRLNPGIPWKTRGNASVVLRIDESCNLSEKELMEITSSFIDSYQGDCKHRNSSPGIVIYKGYPWIKDLRAFYLRTLNDIVLLDDARKIMDKYSIMYNNGRGVIGALAGIASLGPGDPYTFELLAYRHPEYWGKERYIDYQSVFKYDLLTGELTFSNIDLEKKKQIITPHGPDPIYFGVRGINPEKLLLALEEIKVNEPIHGWCIYRTNQATSAHEKIINPPKYYRTSKYNCTINNNPKKIPGGHIILEAECHNTIVNLAFYRESYPLNKLAVMLQPGDRVAITGSVKQRSTSIHPTVTVEVLYVKELTTKYIEIAPRCPKCGTRMKSKGKNKGYACPKCGYYDRNAKKIRIMISRNIVPGRYTPTPMHTAHLVAPNWLHLPVLRGIPFTPVNGFCGYGVNSPVNDPLVSNGAHRTK
ncbi:MAG: tRNA(Ile)(2)-agmatinylcytidine synthase [Desulfurococcales archaeon]|nr:tRNA(Ile)(2)-agmatinylcytidine synthase [Desulfurococcales archaeon]